MKEKIGIIDYVGVKAGMNYYSLGLLEALAKKGHTTVYCSNLEKNQSANYLSTIVYCFDPKIKKSSKGLFNLLIGILKAVFHLKKIGVNILIFHLFESNTMVNALLKLFKLIGFKVYGIIHDIHSFDRKNSFWAEEKIYNSLLDKIIVHNEFSRKALIKKASFNNCLAVEVIPHGNYLAQTNNYISHEEAIKKLKLDPTIKYALFFGQIKTVKGLDILLQAFPKTESTKLIIAGQVWKDSFQKYENIIKERSLENHVELIIRYISDEERDYFFRAASFIILPYKKIYQSGVLLMAMSYGLPAIVSNLPPNKEIGENIAVQFISEDVADLNEKITFMIENSKERIEIGKRAKQLAISKFNWDKIADNYEMLFSN